MRGEKQERRERPPARRAPASLEDLREQRGAAAEAGAERPRAKVPDPLDVHAEIVGVDRRVERAGLQRARACAESRAQAERLEVDLVAGVRTGAWGARVGQRRAHGSAELG